jgi:thioredoxin reductase (NADPH)
VIASGVRYRRLDIPELEARIGAGVYYGSPGGEAEAMAGLDVCVVGGGNSAGQAALHLAQHARRVTLLVRSAGLAESMSDYLLRDLERAPEVDVRLNTRIVGGDGEPRLQTLTLRDVAAGSEEVFPTDALFVLIGGDPTTGWLPPSIARDPWGYVLTGADVPDADRSDGRSRSPQQFETSVHGVFAAGDVRHGSAKRVASAVGDGSVCMQEVHRLLVGSE